jgi:hypothetical protein
VRLILALDRCILATLFAENVNAHVATAQSYRLQDIRRDIGEAPYLGVAAHVAKIENTEFLKDVATDGFVVPRAHLGEGVRRLAIPGLTLGDEGIKESDSGGRPPEENAMKKGFHRRTVRGA